MGEYKSHIPETSSRWIGFSWFHPANGGIASLCGQINHQPVPGEKLPKWCYERIAKTPEKATCKTCRKLAMKRANRDYPDPDPIPTDWPEHAHAL